MTRTIGLGELPVALIDQLARAERLVVLSGAGLSAESGIPTFREAQTGLWAQYDPMSLASPEGFSRHPERVWQWYEWRRRLVADARPNPGHEALVRLQQERTGTILITQNVDGLLQRAGGTDVLELHGSLRRTICSVTRRPIESAWLNRQTDSPPPSPHHPDGLARPDVVWFGEPLRETVLRRAINAARNCDLMLIVSTSGLVHPAASLPELADDAGAILIEINLEPTALSPLVHWRWPAEAGAALPRLIDAL